MVYPITPMPTFKRTNVDQGKQAFLTKGCAKCHGDDGRGMLATNVGEDVWGFPTKAADLTSGMLHGGTEPLDIYRHIFAGINGTPMPSFRDRSRQSLTPCGTWFPTFCKSRISVARGLFLIPDCSRAVS